MRAWLGERRHGRMFMALGAIAALMALLPAAAASVTDPREGLSVGWLNAGSNAAGNLAPLAQRQADGLRQPGEHRQSELCELGHRVQRQLCVRGQLRRLPGLRHLEPGSGDAEDLRLCGGGQGDLSVYGNLLFMSVEETRAKIDCTLTPAATLRPGSAASASSTSATSRLPVPQIAAVQTCRGSHTHTLVTSPSDPDNIYVYVSGTAGIRSAAELAGCNGNSSLTDPTTANFRIDVIKVPLAAPQTAAIVSHPRVFSKCGSSACEADYAVQEQHPIARYGIRGTLNWLNTSGRQPTLSGRRPAVPWRPERLAEQRVPRHHRVSRDRPRGRRVPGRRDPARHLRPGEPGPDRQRHRLQLRLLALGDVQQRRDEGHLHGRVGRRHQRALPLDDRLNWGANAIFDIVDRKMVFRSYYKMPAIQTSQENCVAHNGSLVPVPGRDIMTQAWYQGGLSVLDFTDSAHPKELAFFDRGPISTPALTTGGFWSTYWYNGYIYGTEIARGFDSFGLAPTADLSVNEIAAAGEPSFTQFNAQLQPRITWEPSFAVVRSFRDQLVRAPGVDAETLAQINKFVDRAEKFASGHQQSAAARSCTRWRISSKARSTTRCGPRSRLCPPRRSRTRRRASPPRRAPPRARTARQAARSAMSPISS